MPLMTIEEFDRMEEWREGGREGGWRREQEKKETFVSFVFIVDNTTPGSLGLFTCLIFKPRFWVRWSYPFCVCVC